MSSLPSAIMNSGGGTKKPFSYCPGGIDFSELKSPKIARRIAKHQAGMNEPSSTLPPPQKVFFCFIMIVMMRVMSGYAAPTSLHHVPSDIQKCLQHQDLAQCEASDGKTEEYQRPSDL